MRAKPFVFLPPGVPHPDNRGVDSRPLNPAAAAAADPAQRLQRISGPYKGYYVLAFALPVNGKFAGRAKIYVERPGADRNVRSLEKVSSVGAYATEEKAVQAAEYQARYVIDGLTPNWAPFTAPGMT